MKLKCCNAEIRADCADEGTCCMVCTKCNKPCNWVEDNDWNKIIFNEADYVSFQGRNFSLPSHIEWWLEKIPMNVVIKKIEQNKYSGETIIYYQEIKKILQTRQNQWVDEAVKMIEEDIRTEKQHCYHCVGAKNKDIKLLKEMKN